MSTNGHIPVGNFSILERTSASKPALADLDGEICQALSGLHLPPAQLSGRRIAVTAGSRGIVNLKEIVKAACGWLKAQGANPFVFPAMGSHGGSTAEGQRAILEEYGVTPDYIGAEIRSDMATVRLGETPEGFQAFMDRNAFEADTVFVLNRVKPHTDFSGNMGSGLLKMMAVGMGKRDGASETHRLSRKHGYERVIRQVSSLTLSSGKILCGLAVVENEMHQIAACRAALPKDIVATEEALFSVSRALLPRLPFPELHLLVVDEMGKNISGTGMDTNVIGRGLKFQPGESAEIGLIYVRDLTPASGGNALGVGLADAMHERLYRKIDLKKTYINVQTSLNPPMGRMPMYFPSDRAALDFTLAALGSPSPNEQRVAWVRNTLGLNRVAISQTLAREARSLPGWQLADENRSLDFDSAGDLESPVAASL